MPNSVTADHHKHIISLKSILTALAQNIITCTLLSISLVHVCSLKCNSEK